MWCPLYFDTAGPSSVFTSALIKTRFNQILRTCREVFDACLKRTYFSPFNGNTKKTFIPVIPSCKGRLTNTPFFSCKRGKGGVSYRLMMRHLCICMESNGLRNRYIVIPFHTWGDLRKTITPSEKTSSSTVGSTTSKMRQKENDARAYRWLHVVNV